MVLSVCICLKIDQGSQRTAEQQERTFHAAQAITEALYKCMFTKLLLLGAMAVPHTQAWVTYSADSDFLLWLCCVYRGAPIKTKTKLPLPLISNFSQKVSWAWTPVSWPLPSADTLKIKNIFFKKKVQRLRTKSTATINLEVVSWQHSIKNIFKELPNPKKKKCCGVHLRDKIIFYNPRLLNKIKLKHGSDLLNICEK